MRAPPEAVTETSGTPRSVALSHVARMLLDRRAADHHRLAESGRELRLRQPLGVGAQVEEVEWVVGAQLAGLLGEAVLVHELADPLPRVYGEVMAALGTDPQARLELVVAVVRAAAGARVRMRTPVVLGRGVLVLDRDVDSF